MKNIESHSYNFLIQFLHNQTMKIKLKIEGENVTIKDGKVICENKVLKGLINEIIERESQGPEKGYYPSLSDYFSSVEFLEIEDEENLIY